MSKSRATLAGVVTRRAMRSASVDKEQEPVEKPKLTEKRLYNPLQLKRQSLENLKILAEEIRERLKKNGF